MATPQKVVQFSATQRYAEKVASGDSGGYDGDMTKRIINIEARLGILESEVKATRQDVRELKALTASLPMWIVGTAITIIAAMIAFDAFQATWFQQSLDRNWEMSLKALELIQKK
jgi:hypothetical protein